MAKGWFLAYGVFLELGFLWLTSLGNLRAQPEAFLIVFGLVFLLYLLGIRRLWSNPVLKNEIAPPPKGGGVASSVPPRSLRSLAVPPRNDAVFFAVAVVAFAVLFRATLFFSPPSLSDDIYRYFWDGRLQTLGVNPYGHAPSDPALAPFRDAAYNSINHKDLATVYPPLTEQVFGLAFRLAPFLWAQKIPFILADLGVVFVLLWLLKARRRSPLWALLYAWNPLVIVEFAGSGHNDALGLFFLMLGLALWEARRRFASAMGLAVCFLSKYASLLLVPWWILHAREWKKLATAAGLVLAFLLPHHEVLGNAVASLGHLAHRWQFNGSLYPAVYAAFFPWVSKPVFRILWGALGVAALWRIAGREEDPLRYMFLAVGFVLVISPVVHPWYVTWIVPFLCFFPNRAFIALTGLVVLSYQVLVSYVRLGIWEIHPAWQALEYAVFYALLAWPFLRRRLA